MKLFCFASRNLENIRRGVRAGRWAVATVSDVSMKGRITKARKNLEPGDRGLLYCNPTHSFTSPFIVTSKADPTAVVADIWPEPWVLPFWIRPLGEPDKQLHMDEARARWPLLQRRMPPYTSVSAALNFTGSTVFVPVEITKEDWQIILSDLATPENAAA
jgi:hypothetical protein